MNQRTTYITGILMAGLGVIIGAFGAHALKTILQQTGRAETFELAVRYQFYHAFALVVTGILMNQFQSGWLRYASLMFVLGIVLFSGSLYILAVTGITVLGAITPLGGLCFIAGWTMLLWGVSKK
jgi:uncharacterized membrane protein YgdD (TMEM256/DUF423 family)